MKTRLGGEVVAGTLLGGCWRNPGEGMAGEPDHGCGAGTGQGTGGLAGAWILTSVPGGAPGEQWVSEPLPPPWPGVVC